MTEILDDAKRDLVIANRILAFEGILDALGHVSIRHPEIPERFILARASRSPGAVEFDDLLDLNLDGSLVDADGPTSYAERFIHAAAYEANPDLMAVVHSHDPEILPFTISKTLKLKAVIHNGRFLGGGVDVWDIADDFGTETSMLVRNQEIGRSLVRAMGDKPIVLIRGHGCVVVSSDLHNLVHNTVMMAKNAQVQLAAMAYGDITPIYPGEYEPSVRSMTAPREPGSELVGLQDRPWNFYQHRAGLL